MAAIGAACLLGQALPGRLKLVGYLAVFLAAVGVALSLFAPASLTVGDRPLTYLFFLPALILVVLPVGNERLGLAMLAWVLITFMACAFRNRAEHQWDETNMAPLVQYLQAKEQPEGVVLVNDPELSEAFNYYYSGPMACLPMAAGQSDLESQVAGRAQVFLTVWSGRNVEATTQASRWLDSRFQREAENDFGSLRVISYERPQK